MEQADFFEVPAIGFTYYITSSSDSFCATRINYNGTGSIIDGGIAGAGITPYTDCNDCINSNPCPSVTPTPTNTPTLTQTPTPSSVICDCYRFQNETGTSDDITYTNCSGVETTITMAPSEIQYKCVRSGTSIITTSITYVPCTSPTTCTDDTECSGCSF